MQLDDVESGKRLRIFEGHDSFVKCCAFSPDGQMVLSGSIDKTLRLWNITNDEPLKIFTGHDGSVNGCAFSPEGDVILSASDDKTLRLWDVATATLLHIFEGHFGHVLCCAFDTTGSYAASVSTDSTLRIWDIVNKKEYCRWCSDESLYCCAFSPKDNKIIVGDRAGGFHFLSLVAS